MSEGIVNTSKYALTTYFNCETGEGVGEYPKVCITAEVSIDKGMVHHINTDEIKAAIEKAVMTSVWLYGPATERDET